MNQELYNKWKNRPLSWSQISSFEYDPEQWYQNYFLGIKSKPNEEMLFGSKVGHRLEKDLEYLPMIARERHMEYEFKATFDGIQLIGYADSFCDEKKSLLEYKSGVKPWDKKRVDTHGQLDMYLFMYYLTTKVKPEEVSITLYWMPTVRKESGDFTVTIDFVDDIENNIKSFSTKRTMSDILNFGIRIKNTIKEMESYIVAKNS